jgi:hypothetical protein
MLRSLLKIKIKREEVNATNSVRGGEEEKTKKKMDRQLIESHPLVWNNRLFFFLTSTQFSHARLDSQTHS